MTSDPTEAEPTDAEPTDAEPPLQGPDEKDSESSALKRWGEKALKLLPWISLVVAVVSAFIMDRSPKSAWLVVLAAIFGWGAMVGFAVLNRLQPERFSGRRVLVLKASQLLVLVLMQSLMQQCFFFSLPFYIRAATFSPGQLAFLAAVVSGAVITMWDPLYEWVVALPGARFAMQGGATFCGLNAVLPVLGMSNQSSLLTSALIAAIGAPIQAWLTAPAGEKAHLRVAIFAVFGGGLVPLLLAFGGARLIPPAPLKLSLAQIGTQMHDHHVVNPTHELFGVPKRLYCLTGISGPYGVHDKIVHVWRRNGIERDRVPLTINGGNNKSGWRTFSRKTRFGPDPYGRWSCSVETVSGQLLGVLTVDIRPVQ